jgi:phosphotransferase system HPr-like phosphotransfer protein
MEDFIMKEVKIVLSNIQDIRDFVNQVILVDYDVDLVQGRYVVDAKSIMGIFSLDLLSPITLQAQTDYAEDLISKIEKFIVK